MGRSYAILALGSGDSSLYLGPCEKGYKRAEFEIRNKNCFSLLLSTSRAVGFESQIKRAMAI